MEAYTPAGSRARICPQRSQPSTSSVRSAPESARRLSIAAATASARGAPSNSRAINERQRAPYRRADEAELREGEGRLSGVGREIRPRRALVHAAGEGGDQRGGRLAYERALPPGAQPPRAGEIPRRAEGLALYEIAVVGEPFRRLALVPARGEPGERRAQRPRRARAREKAVRRRGARLAPGEGFQPGNVEISHIPARFHGNTSKYIVESILPAARRTIRKV